MVRIVIKILTSSRTAIQTVSPGVVDHITVSINFGGTPETATNELDDIDDRPGLALVRVLGGAGVVSPVPVGVLVSEDCHYY